MGAFKIDTMLHDDNLKRFTDAALDPELAELVRTGALPDSAFALAQVAPYIAERLWDSIASPTA